MCRFLWLALTVSCTLAYPMEDAIEPLTDAPLPATKPLTDPPIPATDAPIPATDAPIPTTDAPSPATDAPLGTATPEVMTRACERKSLQIACPLGSTIQITDAMYGRTSRSVCPGSAFATNCKSSVALQKVKESCEKMQNCSVSALNSVFGDPCRFTNKYLEVKHRCFRPTFEEKVCEFKSKQITCQPGTKIQILHAMYGRSDAETCKIGNYRNTQCVAGKSISKTKEVCEGKESCTLKALNSVYGEPCIFISKYLHVRYTCA